MIQHTCPLCGGTLSALHLSQHRVPKEKWSINFVTKIIYSSTVAHTFYPHMWRLGNDAVCLYACNDCGHVQAIKEEDE